MGDEIKAKVSRPIMARRDAVRDLQFAYEQMQDCGMPLIASRIFAVMDALKNGAIVEES